MRRFGFALAALAAAAGSSAAAAEVSRSVEVHADPARVWAAIGPFCAIEDWHPAIGSCRLDSARPPTRTLVTRDHAVFVERQLARDDRKRFYTYSFLKSPLPVSHYSATIKVTPHGAGMSTVSWRGVYTPDPGGEHAAQEALGGIYESGLAAIQARLAR